MSLANPNPEGPITLEDRDEEIRGALDLWLEIKGDMPPMPDQIKEMASGSADFLRNLFPDLTDQQLAAFAAYVFTNIAHIWSNRGGQDLLALAIHYGGVLESLAWSLNTPEAPEPETKGA